MHVLSGNENLLTSVLFAAVAREIMAQLAVEWSTVLTFLNLLSVEHECCDHMRSLLFENPVGEG